MNEWVDSEHKASFAAVFAKLLANSSSHGLPNIQRSKHPVGKLFWALLFLAGVGVLCWQVTMLAATFKDRDVVVQLKMEFNNSIDFPVVTICNINAVRLEALYGDIDMALELLGPDSSYYKALRRAYDRQQEGGGGGGGGGSNHQSGEDSLESSDFSYSYSEPPPPPPGGEPTQKPPPPTPPPTPPQGGPTQGEESVPETDSPPSEQESLSHSEDYTPSFDSSSFDYQTLLSDPSGTTPSTGQPAHSAGTSKPTSATPEEMLPSTTWNPNDFMANNFTNSTNTTSYFDWDSNMDDGDYYGQLDGGYELQQLLRHAMAMKNSTERKAMGHDIRDMLVDCVWMGYPCSPRNFTRVPNAVYGNCYMFHNERFDKPLKTNRPGATYGLTLELFVDQDNYVPEVTETAGIRVVIHPQKMVPFPEDNGISVSPGYSTEIGLRLVTVERQGSPYGTCVDINNLPDRYYQHNIYMKRFNVSYSVDSCEKSCYQDTLIKNCSCFNADYPPTEEGEDIGTHPCDILENIMERDCMAYVSSLFLSNKLNCDCPQPCQEKSYLKSMSFSKWPAKNYQKKLERKIAQRLPRRNDDNNLSGWTKDNIARLQIYFEELNYQFIKENPAYTEFDLCSDIGGQLGLWIGVSMITVFEVFEFLASVLTLMTRKILSSGAMMPVRSVTPIQKIRLSEIDGPVPFD